ncbi:unnamed protein product [Angiostrongylus costaricensis]|uniref:C2 domain-containing protein n=1 Tax=Angiostrongylus costaricensis TaxID=334426 RepID=A0A0R3PX48_ANGCS|nr:unnamed protein product [Angiostrongylus costaricensis]
MKRQIYTAKLIVLVKYAFSYLCKWFPFTIRISLYFSHAERQLTVCIERAADLPSRADGSPRNPYVKIFLLPDRSEKSRRQTTVLAEAVTPVWNESFYYQGITEPMLMERVLEV